MVLPADRKLASTSGDLDFGVLGEDVYSCPLWWDGFVWSESWKALSHVVMWSRFRMCCSSLQSGSSRVTREHTVVTPRPTRPRSPSRCRARLVISLSLELVSSLVGCQGDPVEVTVVLAQDSASQILPPKRSSWKVRSGCSAEHAMMSP